MNSAFIVYGFMACIAVIIVFCFLLKIQHEAIKEQQESQTKFINNLINCIYKQAYIIEHQNETIKQISQDKAKPEVKE